MILPLQGRKKINKRWHRPQDTMESEQKDNRQESIKEKTDGETRQDEEKVA